MTVERRSPTDFTTAQLRRIEVLISERVAEVRIEAARERLVQDRWIGGLVLLVLCLALVAAGT